MILLAGDPPGTRAIRGFTLTNSAGHAVDIENFAQAGQHVVENCRFIANGPETALMAGFGVSVDILSNEFVDNEGEVYGGAIIINGPASIRGNLFRNNAAK